MFGGTRSTAALQSSSSPDEVSTDTQRNITHIDYFTSIYFTNFYNGLQLFETIHTDFLSILNNLCQFETNQ